MAYGRKLVISGTLFTSRLPEQSTSISSKMASPTSSHDKTLVLQFSVKHEKQGGTFCGGGYIKLLGKDLDQKNFGGDSP